MAEASQSAFADPDRHASISGIIRRHSTNARDVREAVLEGLDLSLARRVLDLGCGFGFMTEVLARRVADDALIVGVDACAANERPYLQRLAATARSARFVRHRLEDRLDWPSHTFDLVVASYSLYFFPRVLPEAARVLHPEGLFLATTHTESSYRALLRAAGLEEAGTGLLRLIDAFSAETGPEQLSRWFERVERVDYRNSLVFERQQFDEFLSYLGFQLSLIEEPCGDRRGAVEPLADTIRAALSDRPRVVVEKDDAAFRCWGPRCG